MIRIAAQSGDPTDHGQLVQGVGEHSDELSGTIEDAYPLSPMQSGILFHSLVAERSGVYVEQLLCDLDEEVDEDALQRAWQTVIGRHPILRTDFRWADLTEPQQQVHTHTTLPWDRCDWSGISGPEQERRLADFLMADRQHGFDLAQAPLFRLTLLRRGEVKHTLIWTFHHVLLDGRSLFPVLREVFSYYEAFRTAEALTIKLPRPYRDYIAWMSKRDFSGSEAFWRTTLAGFSEPTRLILDDLPGRKRPSEIGGERQIRLSTEITSALRSLAQTNQLGLSTIVMGAWSLALSRYSGDNEVVFGVTRDCRRRTIEDAEGVIGVCINTLPVRVRMSKEALLIPWLKGLRAQSLAIRAHEHTPLEKVQGWSDIQPGKPLFQSILVFEDFDLSERLRQQGGAWTNRAFLLLQQTSYPITVAAYAGAELCLKIGFDRNRLDDAAAGRMLGNLERLLVAIAEDPQQSIGDLPILPVTECHQLVADWNQTEAAFPSDLCVHELFEAQVERTPEAVAVEFGHEHLTYRELDDRSNEIASSLERRGVGPEVLVGLCANRSADMVIGLLGILKAGGAYVPIDPTYPAARIEFMLNNVNARVVLTERNLRETLPALKATEVICIDDPGRIVPIANRASGRRKAIADNLAYVNYTSGTTGNPKGVMIPHRAVVNVISWLQSAFPLGEPDRVLQHISISFDPSVLEILAPLTAGGRLVLAKPGAHQDPAYLVRAIIQHRITVLHLVPSMLRMLLEVPELKACRSLRHVFCGGEVLAEDLVRRLYEVLDVQLHHVYGPTEVAVTSVFYSVPPDRLTGRIPIGRPVWNTQAYVLDENRQPVPIGAAGELYLGGVQVGRGYYNEPELTRDRFIPDPFKTGSRTSLYRTGDLARYLPDGNIEFLGRLDHQVKIRGRRIELDEINAVIERHPSVRESIVVLRESVPGGAQLIAYVTLANSVSSLPRILRGFLKGRLPTYMIPAAFVVLDSFPLTISGKIDRAALPAPEPLAVESDLSAMHVPPGCPVERALADIWGEFLRVRRIGIDDNFFEVGGDSLMMVAMTARINEAMGINLAVEDVFQNPTVRRLAKVILACGSNIGRSVTVIQLQQGSSQSNPPVFFIDPGPDENRLAGLLNSGHPIFGIRAPWPAAWWHALANNQPSRFPRLDELAALYAEALSSHACSSPCVLAGYSFAGLLAFEVAHQIQNRGGAVKMVLLLDTWAKRPNAYEAACCYWGREWMGRSVGLLRCEASRPMGLRILRSWLVAQWLLGKGVNRALREVAKISAKVGARHLPSPVMRDILYGKMANSYRPQALNSRGVLFRSESADGSDQEYYRCAVSPSLGWDNLFTDGLEIVSVPGDHSSMLRQHDTSLAQRMTEVLRQY